MPPKRPVFVDLRKTDFELFQENMSGLSDDTFEDAPLMQLGCNLILAVVGILILLCFWAQAKLPSTIAYLLGGRTLRLPGNWVPSLTCSIGLLLHSMICFSLKK